MTKSALTDPEKERFEQVREAGFRSQLVLLRCTLDGKERAALVWVLRTEDDQYKLAPLAILLHDDELDRITLNGQTTEAI